MSTNQHDTDSKLRGVLIGAGFFAGIQAEAWNRIPAVSLVAVADPDVSRAKEFARQWEIPNVYASAEEMLKEQDPDFADIATRPDSHRQLVETVADHGCHAICQKPMASNLMDCHAMVQFCQSKNVRLLIHENWRWQPWYRAAKRAFEKELGQPFNLNFRVRTGDGIGPNAYTVQPYFFEMERFFIFETLVHHLDTSRFLAGEIESIFCRTQRINQAIAGEDAAVINLRFESGALGLIDGNRANGPVPAPKVFGLLEIEAENGALRLDDSARIWMRKYGQPDEVEYEYHWNDQGYRGDSVLATQEHLAHSLLTGADCESEGHEYLKTVKAVEACYRSAETDSVVKMSTIE